MNLNAFDLNISVHVFTPWNKLIFDLYVFSDISFYLYQFAMFPLVQYFPILHILNLFVRLIRVHVQDRQNHNDDHDIDTIFMLSVSVRILLQFMQLIILISTYMKQIKLKQKWLMKPHLLIRLLHDYR